MVIPLSCVVQNCFLFSAAVEGKFQRLEAAANRTLSIDDALGLLEHKGFDSTKHRELIASLADDTGIIDVSNLLDSSETNLLTKVLTDDLAMPDWAAFTRDVRDLYDDIQKVANSGRNADYIPILAEQDSDWFAVSICTVDGQTFTYGNTEPSHMFSIQSGIKPMLYAAAVEQNGLKKVHRHVGIEPSGLAFNEVSLNVANRPHNPMINAGAIATGSLVRPDLDMAARFRFFKQLVSDVAGGEKIGFSQPTYLCEQETAWRNNALMYYMTNAGVFSHDSDPLQALDFYIQACSMEVNTRIAANLAATLATGGVSPLTGKRCFSPVTTKSCLTLMFSCGMYDYSGEWCTKIGLPAKSGVAGLVYVVIPHVLGMAVYSPPLDSHGNSVRGVEFCKRLLERYRFGIFDQIVSGMRSSNVVRSLATDQRPGNGAKSSVSPSKKKGRQASSAATTKRTSSSKKLTCGNDSVAPSEHTSSKRVSQKKKARVIASNEYDDDDEGIYGSDRDPGSASAPSPAHEHENGSSEGSSNDMSDVDEACASGGVLERWRSVLSTFGRWFKMLRVVSVWCDHAFLTDADYSNRNYCEYDSSEDRNKPEDNCDRACGSTNIPRWIPLEYLYRLLAECGIGPVDHKYTPALYETMKLMRKRSRDRLRDLSAKAKARVDQHTQNSNRMMTTSDLTSLLSGLIEWAPDRFDFGLRLESILSDYQEVDGKFSPRWNYLTNSQNAWLKTRFIKGSAPDLAKRGSSFGAGEFIYAGDLFVPEGHTNIVVRALLNNLAMPIFKGFCRDVSSIASLALRDLQNETSQMNQSLSEEKDESGMSRHRVAAPPRGRTKQQAVAASAANASSGIEQGNVYAELDIEELVHANPSNFGVSVCTVDGQQYNWGDADVDFPLMSAVQPLLYSLSLKDVGVNETHSWVATEPTSTDPASFSLMSSAATPGEQREKPRPKPFNPFMDSGALAVCATLGGAHLQSGKKAFRDTGSRFMHIIQHITDLAGGRRIGFNNSVFLAQKEKRLQTLAVSHFMKGMGAYPESTEPTDNAHLLFQAQSVEINSEKLAIIAASLANIGVCPTTNKRVLERDEMRSVFSLMYNCGLNQYTGTWAFSVGIPASAGISGACLIIIPNIMGIAIYSPRLNEWGIPPLALKFCEALTARYRINIFDQLVYRDEELDIRADEERVHSNHDLANLSQKARSTLLFFELCSAASEGDAAQVRDTIEDGADVNQCDYDKRTALHIAACDGNAEIARILLEEGANILARDRWGSTPYDEAARQGSTDLISMFEDEMVRQNMIREKTFSRPKKGNATVSNGPTHGDPRASPDYSVTTWQVNRKLSDSLNASSESQYPHPAPGTGGSSSSAGRPTIPTEDGPSPERWRKSAQQQQHEDTGRPPVAPQ
eukprot:gb/GECG01014115.1/.p1 GENE.gb/GECG01014115.1/~~gb/GECG01014115.1/.p1  ORF type:complete len:1394 (+),score=186.92 gb/GECG01014115.1/:1-4182(+)